MDTVLLKAQGSSVSKAALISLYNVSVPSDLRIGTASLKMFWDVLKSKCPASTYGGVVIGHLKYLSFCDVCVFYFKHSV